MSCLRCIHLGVDITFTLLGRLSCLKPHWTRCNCMHDVSTSLPPTKHVQQCSVTLCSRLDWYSRQGSGRQALMYLAKSSSMTPLTPSKTAQCCAGLTVGLNARQVMSCRKPAEKGMWEDCLEAAGLETKATPQPNVQVLMTSSAYTPSTKHYAQELMCLTRE